MSAETRAQPSLKLFYLAFVIANLFLASYFIDIWVTPGSTSRALPVLSLYNDNSLVIDKYEKYSGDKSKVGEHFYSDKAPLPSFIVYPFYVACRALGINGVTEAEVQKRQIYIWESLSPQWKDGRIWTLPESTIVFILGSFLCASVPFVLFLFLAFRYVRKEFPSISPVLLVMLSFYGSFIFVFAGVFSGHLLAGLLLFCSYILVKENRLPIAAGLMMGLAFATEYTVAFIIPLWAVQMYLNKVSIRNIALFALGAVPGGLLIMYYNYTITGSPFKLLYTFVPQANEVYKDAEGLGFSYPKGEALWGLLFSQYRGLLFYAPVLLVILWYFVKSKRRDISNFFSGDKSSYLGAWARNYLLLACIGYLLIISSHSLWWGGWAYGPRHFIPIAFLLIYEGILLLSKQNVSKIAFFLATAGGLLCAWLAKATKLYMLPDQYKRPVFEVLIPDFTKNKFNANNILTWAFDMQPKTAIWIWLVLFAAACYGLTVWYNKLVPAVARPVSPAQKHQARKVKR